MKPFHQYQNPALTVDLVLFGYREGVLSVLLLQRAEEPFAGAWTLPGAFVGVDETLAAASARVLRQKLGLEPTYLEQLYTFDAPNRDPRGRVVSVAHYALLNPAAAALTAGAMATDLQWCNTERVPTLGFDHKAIFKAALQRLRSKILYAPLGFSLLDESFTLPELHALYECILDTEMDRRNFTRKILASGLVLPTGQTRHSGAARPAELYRFNKKLKSHALALPISTGVKDEA